MLVCVSIEAHQENSVCWHLFICMLFLLRSSFTIIIANGISSILSTATRFYVCMYAQCTHTIFALHANDFPIILIILKDYNFIYGKLTVSR